MENLYANYSVFCCDQIVIRIFKKLHQIMGVFEENMNLCKKSNKKKNRMKKRRIPIYVYLYMCVCVSVGSVVWGACMCSE